MLMHGSCRLIRDELKPMGNYQREKLIFGTNDYFYALVRCGRFEWDEILIREDYNGSEMPYQLIEVMPGAFEKVFDTCGFIYWIDDSGFIPTNDINEYISKKPAKIVETKCIPNVWMEMLKYQDRYELIRYEEADEYWKQIRGGRDGYIARRIERIKKMREAQ